MTKEGLVMQRVHNVMEDAVADLLQQQWRNLPAACHCDGCKADVYALTLNRLKPHYVRMPVGSMYVKAHLMTVQSRATILTALTESVKIISADPHH
ncbi:hypothetical protein NBRC111894_2604 [Sporolactobacillus inulinus]|uniref:Competence protein ComFB n=3 Tax=Sporolactobacillus inulinus TaxID=2078 RepID=A0A4Y1ZDK0_9BACL|nr:late competence development ComFB family protein [Sporolactobacillus inulinus]GAY77050.1 hypothetical protein NBRC111894_2604 [Sporolactobacillus inulinus]